MSAIKDLIVSVRELCLSDPHITNDEMASFLDVSYDEVASCMQWLYANDPEFREEMAELEQKDPAEYDYQYDADFDGQPSEAQEWHDFDPDC